MKTKWLQSTFFMLKAGINAFCPFLPHLFVTVGKRLRFVNPFVFSIRVLILRGDFAFNLESEIFNLQSQCQRDRRAADLSGFHHL
jgi:hypothetical protein